jgi:hypothetical protein
MGYKGIMRRRKERETSKSMDKRIHTVLYKRTDLSYDNYCIREGEGSTVMALKEDTGKKDRER